MENGTDEHDSTDENNGTYKSHENSDSEVNGSENGSDKNSSTNENDTDVNGNYENSGTNENDTDDQFTFIIENNTIDDFLTIFIQDFKRTIASFVFQKKRNGFLFIC